MSLVDVVYGAAAAAKRLNRKVLVNYTIPWQGSDVLQFVAQQGDSHRFFWQRGQLQLGGGGRIWSTASRFDGWRSEILPLVEDGRCPYFFGGLSFAPSGASCLGVPRWLLRVEGAGELLLWDWVAPDMAPEAVVASLEGLLARLGQGQGQPLVVGGGDDRAVIDSSPGWRQVVARALGRIARGELEKVVLARSVEVLGNENFSAFGLLERLRQRSCHCTLFLMEMGRGQTFVGATPEMLLQFAWHHDRLDLVSDALAGSSGRGEFLLRSGKDLREHQIVIDSILDAYNSVGAAVGQIGSPQLLQLQHIQHLHTQIVGTWRTPAWQNVFQLLELLHPTAAVGGRPRAQALEFIRQFEPCDRQGYAAPIGWFNGEGRGEFAVAIRSGYVTGNRVKMFAGAGIVQDSQIDREWEETNLKLQGMLRALGLAD